MSSTALELPSSRSCTLYTPISGATPAAPASGERKAVKSSEITLTTKDGQTIKAYLAVPDMDTPPSTGVVYVSDIFGCDNSVNREIADLFASYSIPTILPDLYRGDPWPQKPLDETFAPWLVKHPFERILSDTSVAADALRERGFGKPLGLLGFCLGGGRVLDEAALVEKGLNPAAVVSFYGTRFDGAAVGRNLKCAVMFIAGETDPLVPVDDVHLLRKTIETSNSEMKACEILVTTGAGHAFVHRPKSDEDKADSDTFKMKAIGWMSKYLSV